MASLNPSLIAAGVWVEDDKTVLSHAQVEQLSIDTTDLAIRVIELNGRQNHTAQNSTVKCERGHAHVSR